jgi:hypothetical protein
LEDKVGDEVDNFEADGDADMGDGDTGDSEDEYYKQVEHDELQNLPLKLRCIQGVFLHCD